MLWPLSIEGLAGVIAPATNEGLTVTTLPAEHIEATGLPWEESVVL